MIIRYHTRCIEDSSFHLSISHPIFLQYYTFLRNYSLVLVHEIILIMSYNELFTVRSSLGANVCLDFQLFAATGRPGRLVLNCNRPQQLIVANCES